MAKLSRPVSARTTKKTRKAGRSSLSRAQKAIIARIDTQISTAKFKDAQDKGFLQKVE